MLLATLSVVILTAVAAVIIVGGREGSFAGASTTRVVRVTSPIDEAERILAHRYAIGDITAEEYNRMLVILRR